MIDAVVTLASHSGRRSVHLASFLDAEAEERAREQEIAWIKALRHAEVDGAPFRRRFTYRGDSLWWFSEIFLHKQQAIRALFRAIAAFERLAEREAPHRIELGRADRFTHVVARQFAASRKIAFSGGGLPPFYWSTRLARLDARARWLHTTALASRLRGRSHARPHSTPTIAAFIHRAFWRNEAEDGPAESYIGPVLQALEGRVQDGLTYISVGPSENFSAHRWWHAGRSADAAANVIAIESFAPLDALRCSRAVWIDRYRNRRTLWASRELRDAAVIRGCDCWPIVREELAGMAYLQWPWSARVMDEAGAALDAVQPASALTYAEAGGWGRALVLECRRREIPVAGVQHGFIYRHWLNYLHQSDEMAADAANPSDLGFPYPDRTLLFDDFAGQHLIENGNFPPDSLIVTGSPRLDAMVAEARAAGAPEVEHAKTLADGAAGPLVLVVTKYREARSVLPALLDAAAALPDVRVAIKTHPAETPEVYNEAIGRRPHVVVLPASAPLAVLIRASRVVVTVNSTVALDAAVLGIPALVIGLSNNLAPFVRAGAMAGAEAADLPGALQRILYDEKFRQQLERARGLFLARFRILSDGGAAERSADAVLDLVEE
jgi:surface carbohydrate biosynthesis protein (TIGR04326 family)